MTSAAEINPDVLAAIQAKPVAANEDGLRKLRAGVAAVRDLERLKLDQESSLKETNKALQEQYFRLLPDLMDQAGVPEITIAAEGNMPAITARAQPYYKAVIQEGWPEDQKQKAFDWLDTSGHGDLIKTEVTVSFAREDRASALTFAQKLRDEGLIASVSQTVHWGTLTAWLKEQVEKRHILPPLDIIGGTVGRVVKLKEK